MDLQRVVYMFYMMCSWSSMRQWQGPALCQAQTAARHLLTMGTETGSKDCNVAQVWGHQVLSLWLPTGQMSGAQQRRQAKVLGDREDVTEEVELA